jgi:hypothetical protein
MIERAGRIAGPAVVQVTRELNLAFDAQVVVALRASGLARNTAHTLLAQPARALLGFGAARARAAARAAAGTTIDIDLGTVL